MKDKEQQYYNIILWSGLLKKNILNQNLIFRPYVIYKCVIQSIELQ